MRHAICAASRAHADFRQRNHLHSGGSFGCCDVQWDYAPVCGPPVEELFWRPSHQATKPIQLARGKLFQSLCAFSPRIFIREGHSRPARRDSNRASPPCASCGLALAVSRPSLLACEIGAAIVTQTEHLQVQIGRCVLSSRAARLFAGHDCDIMNCRARVSMRGCRGRVRTVHVPAQPTSSLACQVLARSTAPSVQRFDNCYTESRDR